MFCILLPCLSFRSFAIIKHFSTLCNIGHCFIYKSNYSPNLISMINAKNTIFMVHLAIVLAFIVCHSFTSFELCLALICHYLILKNDSSCYPNHCVMPNTTQNIQKCMECNIKKWIRMRHCYKCKKCVHKYDHHCVLMDICIGEFNHRYYLLFLLFFLWNIAKMLVILTLEIREEVSINELGVQSVSGKFYLYAVSLMFLYFQLILTGYLLVYHLYLCSNNTTTWQSVKRDSISYLRYVDPEIEHPFSKGVINNWVELFNVDPQNPIVWQLPERQLKMFNSTEGNY